MRENVIKVPPMSVNKAACEPTQQWDTKLEKEIIAIKMPTCYTYIGFSMGEPSLFLGHYTIAKWKIQILKPMGNTEMWQANNKLSQIPKVKK